MYSPVRVSMLQHVANFHEQRHVQGAGRSSTVAGLVVLEAVSPLKPGSV